MRFSIFCKESSLEQCDIIVKTLVDQGNIFTNENPEYIISVGGDGTMLRAVRKYYDMIDHVFFIGINTGELGFYTDFLPSEASQITEAAMCSPNHDECPLLEYEITFKDGRKIKNFALNEITILNSFRTQILEVYINDHLFETFRGTGLLVSTPSGSTAYNKSLGGAVIDISIDAFQMTEVASINNRVYQTLGSPIILGKESKLRLSSPNFDQATLTTDYLFDHLDQVVDINVWLSDKKIKFLTKCNHTFWHRVKRAFLGK
jgi:NAD+ kinase